MLLCESSDRSHGPNLGICGLPEGREWTEKSQGTKSISREAPMFRQQKDELQLMVQIRTAEQDVLEE